MMAAPVARDGRLRRLGSRRPGAGERLAVEPARPQGHPPRGRLDGRARRALGRARPERRRQVDAAARSSRRACGRAAASPASSAARSAAIRWRSCTARSASSTPRSGGASTPTSARSRSSRPGSRARSCSSRTAGEGKARAALELVGAADVADRAFVTCSEGERERILLARALVADAPLLVLDEPTAGLDLPGRLMLLHALGEALRGAARPDDAHGHARPQLAPARHDARAAARATARSSPPGRSGRR